MQDMAIPNNEFQRKKSNSYYGKRVIAIAPICPALMKKPLNELVNFLNAGLAEKIFSYGDEHPEIIKDHDNSYPILIFEK